MKRLLILTRFVKEYEPKRLAEEGRKLDYSVDVAKYGQINLSVVDGKPLIDLGKERRLADYDLVIPRSASKKGGSMVSVKTAILQAVDLNKTKVVNGESFLKYPLLGKTEQGLLLARAGLPTIPFLTFGSKRGWAKFLKTDLKFPYIVKGRFGSHGRTVKLVNNKDELEKLIKHYSVGNVLIQPVMPIKQWYRCIVCGGEYLGQMVHKQKSKFKSDFSENLLKAKSPASPALSADRPAGGCKLKAFDNKRMNQLKKICLGASELFSCDFCGIDVGWREDISSWVLFEVNRTAQFKYFEKRTSVNVAKKILEVGFEKR